MSYIRPPGQTNLPPVNDWNTEKISRFSTKETTNSSAALVKASNQDRRPGSTSRSGQYQSSGRGGAGNTRATSDCSQRAYISDGPEDFSSTKGRELLSSFDPNKIISTGRGGMGNIRSLFGGASGARHNESSSKTDAEQGTYERSLIRKHEAARATRMWEEVVSETLSPQVPKRQIPYSHSESEYKSENSRSWENALTQDHALTYDDDI